MYGFTRGFFIGVLVAFGVWIGSILSVALLALSAKVIWTFALPIVLFIWRLW